MSNPFEGVAPIIAEAQQTVDDIRDTIAKTRADIALVATSPEPERRPLIDAFARAIETAQSEVATACFRHADAAIEVQRARMQLAALEATCADALASVSAAVGKRQSAAAMALVSVGVDPNGPDAASWEVRTGENAVVRKV